MKIRFMGTAGSEGIPNPFCNCKVCENARKNKGKDERTRASVMVDDCMQIDMSPEWSYQLKREGLTARNVHATLFTHTHPDHFNVGEFVSRTLNFAQNVDFPMHIFGNDCAIKGTFNALDGLGGDRFIFHLVAPFLTYEYEGYKITPILANHAKMELCYNYIIEKDNKVFFYGLDSGYLCDESFNFLKKFKIDVAVLECTYSLREGERTDNHLNFKSLINEVNRLKEQGTLSDKSRVIASHVSHSSGLTHAQTEEILSKEGIEVAYDGLIVNI